VIRIRVLTLAAAVVLLGACATSPRPGATPAPTSGAIDLDWDQSSFSPMACPAGHPTAVCYGGMAKATLPVAGAVTLRRTVVSEPDTAAGPGCDRATSDGTLTDATGGTLPLHAEGKLCSLLATYALTTKAGTGSLSGVVIQGTITNNGGAEHWTATITRPGDTTG
jgi:hypothetical protein